MIKSFRHTGLEKFYRTGSKAGIQPHHAAKLEEQLTALNRARGPNDMDFQGWNCHGLHGTLKNHWSVKVNGNWRVIFTFDCEDAILVDYKDYH